MQRFLLFVQDFYCFLTAGLQPFPVPVAELPWLPLWVLHCRVSVIGQLSGPVSPCSSYTSALHSCQPCSLHISSPRPSRLSRQACTPVLRPSFGRFQCPCKQPGVAVYPSFQGPAWCPFQSVLSRNRPCTAFFHSRFKTRDSRFKTRV